MRNDYIVRKYRVGDEKEINDLFNLVFKQSRSLDEWYWQFRDNPAGSANLITIAEIAGKMVGQYANLPVYFKCKDQTVKVGNPVDNFIHHNFRRRGLLRDMFQFQFLVAEKHGISFGFGMPNEIYYPVGKRFLKYKDLCPLPTLFKRLNWRLAFKKRVPTLPSFLESATQRLSAEFHRMSVNLNSSRERKLSIRSLSSLASDIDRVWERAKDRYGIMITRDYKFLRWRYLDKPHDAHEILVAQDEEPLGYLVTKVARKEGHLIGYIVDILSVDRAVDSFLIEEVLKYFISKKVDYSLCRILKEDEVYNTLLDHGFDAYVMAAKYT